MNSWPALDYYYLRGWILRFSKGVTWRSNSVLPLNYHGSRKTLDQDINHVENAYTSLNLTPAFMMFDYHQPRILKKILNTYNYGEYDNTKTLICPPNEFNSRVLNTDVSYEFYNTRVQEISSFMAKYSSRSEQDQKEIELISNKIKFPQKRFIVAKFDEHIIASMMTVLDPRGYLYFSDILVLSEYRRKGIATSMMHKAIFEWSNPSLVKYIWLQVEDRNDAALMFYDKLGMKELYSYSYYRKVG